MQVWAVFKDDNPKNPDDFEINAVVSGGCYPYTPPWGLNILEYCYENRLQETISKWSKILMAGTAGLSHTALLALAAIANEWPQESIDAHLAKCNQDEIRQIINWHTDHRFPVPSYLSGRISSAERVDK